jgi:hypothetical protein
MLNVYNPEFYTKDAFEKALQEEELHVEDGSGILFASLPWRSVG